MKGCPWWVVSLFLVLAGCASPPSQGPGAPGVEADQAPVFVAFTSHRMGELEPCGCSRFPKGGLQREWEFYRKENFRGLKATAGVSFLPFPESYLPRNLTLYLRKARFLLEGLNQLGTDVLSPGVEDFLLGLDSVQSLAKLAKFPFVSANIVEKKTGKRVFAPYYEVAQGNTLLTFIGLSAKSVLGYPIPSEVEVSEPGAALAAVLASLPAATRSRRLVVVLSSLSGEEQKKLRDTVGQVHFYFGGDLVESEAGFFQEKPEAAWSNPQSRGRSVALLKITPHFPITDLSSEAMAKAYQSLVVSRTEEVKAIEQRLKGKKLSKKERKVDEARRSEIGRDLPRLERMAQTKASGSTSYEGRVVVLGDAYSNKENNPFAPLIERLHEATRRAALGEAESD